MKFSNSVSSSRRKSRKVRCLGISSGLVSTECPSQMSLASLQTVQKRKPISPDAPLIWTCRTAGSFHSSLKRAPKADELSPICRAQE